MFKNHRVEDALLVVDMLKGFLQEGFPLFCGAGARRIIPFVKNLLEARPPRERIYLCDSHAPDDAEFKMFAPHCIKGSEGAKIIPDFAACPGRLIPKTRFSGFYGTCLEETLRELRPKRVVVVGVCTDICVMHTVADLRNRDYNVWVPVKGVASFSAEGHAFALKHMARVLGAEVG